MDHYYCIFYGIQCVFCQNHIISGTKRKTFSKENFGEYFYDDIYFYLACYPTNYYPQKIREDAPYELMLYCITKNKKYTLVSIDNMSISSNLKNNYVSNNKSRLGFNFYYKDKKTSIITVLFIWKRKKQNPLILIM